MLSAKQSYTIKILILFLATGAGIFAIWYALMREESSDWIVGQVVHQASPYAVSLNDDGTVTINNVVAGYEFSLPDKFKTNGARNLILYIEEPGEKKCEIKHYYLNEDKANGLTVDKAKLIISLRQQKLVFELANKSEIDNCGGYLMEIKNKIVVN